MRRGIPIAIGLLSVLLLLKPFDCFSSTGMTREAVDCCAKGKCAPVKNSDDCCRKTVPGSQHFVGTAKKAPSHSLPVLAIVAFNMGSLSPVQFSSGVFANVHSPPGSPPASRLNLPLLI